MVSIGLLSEFPTVLGGGGCTFAQRVFMITRESLTSPTVMYIYVGRSGYSYLIGLSALVLSFYTTHTSHAHTSHTHTHTHTHTARGILCGRGSCVSSWRVWQSLSLQEPWLLQSHRSPAPPLSVGRLLPSTASCL